MQNLREKAIRLGATEFGPSKAKGKKYFVIYAYRDILKILVYAYFHLSSNSLLHFLKN